MIHLLQLKRLYQLKNLGYNYIDLIDIDSDFNEEIALPSDMQLLRQRVENCHLCSFCKTRTQTVFGEGNEDAKIVFVAHAPGATEDSIGRPFVGRAGGVLTKMIENVLELKREDVYITYILKCKPSSAGIGASEIVECKPYILKQLELIKPKLVVALGDTAVTALSNAKLSISEIRGEFIDMKDYKLLATYHPSFLLRNPSLKKESYQDLLKIKSFI